MNDIHAQELIARFENAVRRLPTRGCDPRCTAEYRSARSALSAALAVEAGTDAEWTYKIQYGPEGEANYAWVYRGQEMVATMKTHHAQAVCSALTTSPASSGVEGEAVAWRTMDSAPKDGTPILVAQGDIVKSVAWVSRTREYQELVSTKGNRETYEWKKEDVGYWDADDVFEPTHWMPLPAAPSLSAGAGGADP
jgi:hypothetical protein